MQVFWYDAHIEEQMYGNSNNGTVILFGKCFDASSGKYLSVGVQVQEISRIIYAVPKDPMSDCTDVQKEFREILNTKFPEIRDYRFKISEKNYAFEMPIQNGTSKFLELRYSGKYKPLPNYMKGGETFKHVLGTNTSLLEHLIIQKKIMGPCWLTIQNPVQTFEKQTWCDIEIVCQPSQILITNEDRNRESPNLTVLSFALKTHKNVNKVKEIAMISCVMHEGVDCDNNTKEP